MAIRKVLVVDDSKTELMFMTDLLQKNGFQVKTAESAEDAFRRLGEDKPESFLDGRKAEAVGARIFYRERPAADLAE